MKHVEPVPRRIRAFLDGRGWWTTAALYVWEWPYYPSTTYRWPMSTPDDGGRAPPAASAGRDGRGGTEYEGKTDYRPGAAHLYTIRPSRASPAPSTSTGRPSTVGRGGRGGLRPPPQPLRPGRRPPLHSQHRRRTRRRGAGPNLPTVMVLGTDADPLLLQPHRGELRSSRGQRHVTSCPYKGTTCAYWLEASRCLT